MLLIIYNLYIFIMNLESKKNISAYSESAKNPTKDQKD